MNTNGHSTSASVSVPKTKRYGLHSVSFSKVDKSTIIQNTRTSPAGAWGRLGVLSTTSKTFQKQSNSLQKSLLIRCAVICRSWSSFRQSVVSNHDPPQNPGLRDTAKELAIRHGGIRGYRRFCASRNCHPRRENVQKPLETIQLPMKNNSEPYPATQRALECPPAAPRHDRREISELRGAAFGMASPGDASAVWRLLRAQKLSDST